MISLRLSKLVSDWTRIQTSTFLIKTPLPSKSVKVWHFLCFSVCLITVFLFNMNYGGKSYSYSHKTRVCIKFNSMPMYMDVGSKFRILKLIILPKYSILYWIIYYWFSPHKIMKWSYIVLLFILFNEYFFDLHFVVTWHVLLIYIGLVCLCLLLFKVKNARIFILKIECFKLPCKIVLNECWKMDRQINVYQKVVL